MSRDELKEIIRLVLVKARTNTPQTACIFGDNSCDVTTWYDIPDPCDSCDVTSFYGINEEG